VNSAIFLRTENHCITEAHVSMGGVAPIPLYLIETSAFLIGKKTKNIVQNGITRMVLDTTDWFDDAFTILQNEISPISDVRGSADYKRLLARQLLIAHFVELFNERFKFNDL
jgi:xanthine dehydrogenase small subunit